MKKKSFWSTVNFKLLLDNLLQPQQQNHKDTYLIDLWEMLLSFFSGGDFEKYLLIPCVMLYWLYRQTGST